MPEAYLTVADVAQMAVNMEIKGMHFYNWAASQFKNQVVKDIFLRLSEEEKEHVRVFKRLLELPDAGQKLEEGTGKYLKMIHQGEDIFPHHGEISTDKIKSPAEALSVGIQAEKDAILFYQELYNKSESDQVKKALSKLLEEEKIHLLELRDYMDEINHFKH